MKKVVLFGIISALALCANAQKIKDADVPAAVKTAFVKQYPGIKAKWEKEGVNYEAEFDFNKEETSVVMDAKGVVIEKEVEIDVNSLPKAAVDYITTHYPGMKIKEAAKITDAKGAVMHEAEIKGMDVLFDSTGNFIKEVKEDKGGK